MANGHKDRFRNLYYERYGSSLYKCKRCGSGPVHIKGVVSSEHCGNCGAADWRELTEDEFKFETYLRDDLKLSSFADRQTLPFPIAVVYRKIRDAGNNTQRFSLLIELFDVVVRFIVLVNLADCLRSPKDAEAIILEIPEIGRLSTPSLGDWVSMFKSLSRHYRSTNGRSFLKEFKDFKLDRCARTLDEFVELRNDSLRGHGSTEAEEEYEIKFQEHSPKLDELIDDMGFLANYRLLKTGFMARRGEYFDISAQILMGDNPHFESAHIMSRSPLETDRVFCLNEVDESLLLHPYVVLELCPECKRPEVLLLDKFQGQRITYLSFEKGHKPSFPYGDQLPLKVRELSASRYARKT